jgi:hypothetical protein
MASAALSETRAFGAVAARRETARRRDGAQVASGGLNGQQARRSGWLRCLARGQLAARQRRVTLADYAGLGAGAERMGGSGLGGHVFGSRARLRGTRTAASGRGRRRDVRRGCVGVDVDARLRQPPADDPAQMNSNVKCQMRGDGTDVGENAWQSPTRFGRLSNLLFRHAM